MKINIKKAVGKTIDGFRPIDVIIHVETKKEANGLRHLVGCANNLKNCTSSSMALDVADELENAFLHNTKLVPLLML